MIKKTALLGLSILFSLSSFASELPFFSSDDLTPYWKSDATKYSPTKMTSFELIDKNNQKFTEKEFQSKLSLVNFFFCKCPKICPLMMSRIQEFKKNHANLNLQYVSFSVQAKNDSPAVLTQYAQQHHLDDDWRLITGSLQTIFDLGRNVFKANRLPGKSKVETNTIHSTKLFLIDKSGTLRGIYESEDSKQLELLAKDVAELNKEI